MIGEPPLVLRLIQSATLAGSLRDCARMFPEHAERLEEAADLHSIRTADLAWQVGLAGEAP